jgi:hypothetical protein
VDEQSQITQGNQSQHNRVRTEHVPIASRLNPLEQF